MAGRRTPAAKKNKKLKFEENHTKFGCYTCELCDKAPLIPMPRIPGVKNFHDTLTIDHIVPLSKGGTNNKHNLVVACYECNQKKGNNASEITQLPNRPFSVLLDNI